jgi:SAM-dependent methyltransferase
MTSFDSPTSYPAPLNHHSLYVPSLSSPMPFPDGYFDVIVSRSVSTVLRNDQWARFFFDCRRVLKPGGQLEILSVDAHLNSEGQRMSSWVDNHIVNRLEAHSLSKLPSDTVLDTMEIVNLENIRRARVALPTSLSASKVPNAASSSQDAIDASRMMSFLGRHFYQDLYGKMMRSQPGAEWFWSHPDIQNECERHQTKMVLTIACAHKPLASSPGENYPGI